MRRIVCIILATSSVIAQDRCLNSADLEFHPSVDNIFTLRNNSNCSAWDMGCTRDSCPCRRVCCEEKKDTCYYHRKHLCIGDEVYDPSRGAVMLAKKQADFRFQCCKTRPTCNTFTCPAGWKTKSNISDTRCGSSCEPQHCCEYDLATCFGRQGVGDTCYNNSRKYVGTTATHIDLTAGNFDTKCCADQEQGCQGYTCPDHMVKKTNVDNLYVDGTPGWCCECKNQTCCGMARAMAHHPLGCGSDSSLDTRGYATAVKNISDFKALCCVPEVHCATTWNAFRPRSSSANKRAITVALPLSLFAVLAFR